MVMLLIQGPHFENHFYQTILIKQEVSVKVTEGVLLQQQDLLHNPDLHYQMDEN